MWAFYTPGYTTIGRSRAVVMSFALVVLFVVFARDTILDNGEIYSRFILAFFFWNFVIAVGFPPPGGFNILARAVGLGISLAAVCMASELTYRFVVYGELFREPGLTKLVGAISLPIFVLWSTLSELLGRLHPNGGRRLIVSLIAQDPYFTVFGVLCSAIGVALAISPWNSILRLIGPILPQ